MAKCAGVHYWGFGRRFVKVTPKSHEWFFDGKSSEQTSSCSPVSCLGRFLDNIEAGNSNIESITINPQARTSCSPSEFAAFIIRCDSQK